MARQMKDSGVEWIGEIPEGWKIYRNKVCFECSKAVVGVASSDTQLLSLTTKGIKQKRPEDSTGKVPDSYDTYQLVEPDDIVMCLFDLDVSAVFSGRSAYYGMISPAYKVLKCIERYTLPRFAEYWFAYVFDGRKFRHYSKNLRYTLTYEEFAVLPLAMPPLPEQHRIAAFLDRRCAEIDAVIERTKATIEEYKKLKQAVITEAVTKGVRGERKMKDSGIAWIGEIAEEHPIIKLKYVCQILDQYRSPVTADQRSQNGDVLYDYYGASGPIDKIDGYTIDGHVMLIGEDGANLRLRNLPLMYEVNGKAWINNHAHILKPDDGTEFYYLFFALEALDINPYITGSAQPKLSQENLKNILIPMPTLDEQREITAFIRKRCSALDTLIAKKTSLLTELETYKKSLIFEYVTGKKEVPACP